MNESLRVWLESPARRPNDKILIGLTNEGDEVLTYIRIRLESPMAGPIVLPEVRSLAPREWRLEPVQFPLPAKAGERIPVHIEAYWYEKGRNRGPIVVKDRLEVLPQVPMKEENRFTTLPLEPGNTLFVGREKERDNLLQALDKGKQVIWIIGRRGLGKTTFLKHIPSWLADYSWRYVDCRQITREIQEALEEGQGVRPLSLQGLLQKAQVLSSPDDAAKAGLILDAFEEVEELLLWDNLQRAIEVVEKYFLQDLADWAHEPAHLLILAGDRLPNKKYWPPRMLPDESEVPLEPLARDAIRRLAQQAPFRFDESVLSQSLRGDEVKRALDFLQEHSPWPLVWLSGEPLLVNRMLDLLVEHLDRFHWRYLDAREMVQNSEAELSALLRQAQDLSLGPTSREEGFPEALVLGHVEILEDEEKFLNKNEFLRALRDFVKGGHPLVVIGDKLPNVSNSDDFLVSLLQTRHITLSPMEDGLFAYVGGHPLLAHILLEQLAWRGLEKGYVTFKDLQEARFEALNTHRYKIEYLWAGLTWVERRVLIVTYLRQKRRLGRTLGTGLEEALTEEHLAELGRLRTVPVREEDILEELTRLGRPLTNGLALQRHLLYGRPGERQKYLSGLKEDAENTVLELRKILEAPLWNQRRLLEHRKRELEKQLKRLKRKQERLSRRGVERGWEEIRPWLEREFLPLLQELYQELNEFSRALENCKRMTETALADKFKEIFGRFDVSQVVNELERKGILLQEKGMYRLPALLAYWFDLYEESARSLLRRW